MNNLCIAIPTYNSSLYLEEIFQVLSKFKPIEEVVISDDLSEKRGFHIIGKNCI